MSTPIDPKEAKNQMDALDKRFRLTRLILIDSYCRGRVVEFDLSGHVTINGKNGAGKTTLLRLFPAFLGEKPSKIIHGDAVVDAFSRYYFQTTASYVVFEYQRRGAKALAVIHADGQSDKAAYRLIDSEYKTELFWDGDELVQAGSLHRHLDKLGVFESRALGYHAYRQVIQNTAGREHKQLAARFAFTGASSKLTHIEKVVSGILHRQTTFHDLRSMIVSSIMDNDDSGKGFSLRTGKKDLAHWISEYEAHDALMKKSPAMDGLEQSDHHRRTVDAQFAILHARLTLMRGHLDERFDAARQATELAKTDMANSEREFGAKLQDAADLLVAAASQAKQAKRDLEQVDSRKAQYDKNDAAGQAQKVDALPAMIERVVRNSDHLNQLESEVKPIAQLFKEKEDDAQNRARNERAAADGQRSGVYQIAAQKKDALGEQQQRESSAVRNRQAAEIEGVIAIEADFKIEVGCLEIEARSAQGSPELQGALDAAVQAQAEADARLDAVRDTATGLRLAVQSSKDAFAELERRVFEGESAIEVLRQGRDSLLSANNAGPDTLLGFLRRNKPDWAGNIGKLLSEETLLSSQLSPNLLEGDDDGLYGVDIDLEKLNAGRFASEEGIQAQLKASNHRIEQREKDVEDDRNILEKQSAALIKAKAEWDANEAAITISKVAKDTGNRRIALATQNLADSKRESAAKATARLADCRTKLSAATLRVQATKQTQCDELGRLEATYKLAVAQIKADHDAQLAAIEARIVSVAAALEGELATIGVQRDKYLQSKGVATEVLNAIRHEIKVLNVSIDEARNCQHYVGEYREWLEQRWSERPVMLQASDKTAVEEARLRQEQGNLFAERHGSMEVKRKAVKDAENNTDKCDGTRNAARRQIELLVNWPLDPDTIAAGFDAGITLDDLVADRNRWQADLESCREKIRVGVEDICRQMSTFHGTGPYKFYTDAFSRIGPPRRGQEHEWIEVFRNWFNHEHVTNRTSLLQMGKTIAQNISSFWKGLSNFKSNVSIFAAELKASLEQGKVFDTISDVTTDIRTQVDVQDYWGAVENLHLEYDAWHTKGDSALPPAGFIAAAKAVVSVLSEDKGLVADPVDLISLKISANVNGQGSKTASNERELANMSSNGLSYIILCVVLIGFVNRIRRKEQVVVPFVVDELMDLDYGNTKRLLELLARNNITMISAYSEVNFDLSALFERNYKILPGREVGLIYFGDDKKDVVKDVATAEERHV